LGGFGHGASFVSSGAGGVSGVREKRVLRFAQDDKRWS
jgi:hypothetical protein